MAKKKITEEKATDIYDLEAMDGVGPKSAERLIEHGMHTLCDLIVSQPVELGEILDWDKEKSSELIEKAREVLEGMGFVQKSLRTAKEIFLERQGLKRVTTSSLALDNFMSGGLETKAVYEFFAEFGSGKTQLCHTLAVNIQRPESEGGMGGKCVYIDTENTFRPERIISMAVARGMNPEETLENIIVVRAHNSGHQMLVMDELGEQITNNNVKLIIVDSLMGNFRSEFLGRGTLAPRQQAINRFIHRLLRLCEVYNVVGVITNQAVSNPDAFGLGMKATGGNIVGHASTYRIWLKKSGKKRIANMVDSPMHATYECIFGIDETGIIDAEGYKLVNDIDMDKIYKEIHGDKKIATLPATIEPSEEIQVIAPELATPKKKSKKVEEPEQVEDVEMAEALEEAMREKNDSE